MSSENRQKNYRRVLKSSSIIGGSAFLNVLINMVRAKFAAVYLGPAGVGLLGVYQSLVGMIQTVSGMGISTSGVRKIAEVSGSGEDDKVASTVISLRRVVWSTGTLGMFVLILGSAQLSWYSFGNYDHSREIAFLGIIVLMASIAMGQSCVLQGTRRIADLAKIGVISATLGTMSAVPCFYFFRQNGIVPSMILAAIATLVSTWWFGRKVPVKKISVSWHENQRIIFHLLHFGFPVMLAGFLTVLSLYLIRVLVIRQLGLDAVGIYQAGFALSGLLINFVLQAMGTDYYPRLTAVAHDNRQIGFEINTQTEIALLLAIPLLGATIVFAPLAMRIFYSGAFEDSAALLRWFAFGIYGKVVSWPLGFVILAKGKGKTFFCTELIANMLLLFLTWLCMQYFGLIGASIAYAFLYLFHTGFVLIVCFSLTRESWTRYNLLLIITFGSVLIILGVNSSLNSMFIAKWIINTIALSILSTFCLRRLFFKTGITFTSLQEKFALRGK